MKRTSLNEILEAIVKIMANLTGVMFLIMFLLNVLTVCLRYFWGWSWFWIPDFNRFLFIWIVFTGAAVMHFSGDHLVVDFFVKRGKPRTQKVLSLFRSAVMIVFFAVLIYQGIIVGILRMKMNFTTFALPMGYAFLAVPAAATVMLVISVRNAIRMAGSREEELKGEE